MERYQTSTMQNYSDYRLLNRGELENLSCEQIPTIAVRQWPAQQPVAGLAEAETNRAAQDDMPGSLIDCLVTVGMIMVMLVSSSVMLGFAMGQLGMLMRESVPEVQ